MNTSLTYQGLLENDDESFYLAVDNDNEDDVSDSNFIYIVNTILSGTARLNVLLPTATILSFTIFSPFLTNDGKCNTAFEKYLMGCFLILSAASCVFFSFTDSFKTAKGRLHYGVATFRGIRAFNGRIKPQVPSDYRLKRGDVFHALLSLIAFLTFAASHYDVLDCYHLHLPRKVTNAMPLVIGFAVSVLFVMFPSKRKGIGYPFLLQSDALYHK